MVRPVPDKLAAQFLLRRDGCTGEAFIAVYKSIREALAAVAKLHGQAVAGQQGQQGKKGKQAAAAGAAGAAGPGEGGRLWARQLSGEGLHHKRWRLIVRNLPFTVSSAAGCGAALPSLQALAWQGGSQGSGRSKAL